MTHYDKQILNDLNMKEMPYIAQTPRTPKKKKQKTQKPIILNEILINGLYI